MGLEQIQRLGVKSGDVVAIAGKRTTAALVVPAFPEDEGLEIARMDGLLHSNAKVGIGEPVEVGPAQWAEARSVMLAPAREGLRVGGSGEALRPTLVHRALTEGDLISTSAYRRPPHLGHRHETAQHLFHTHAYGLMELRLLVTSAVPRGIVRVSETTQIELLPKFRGEPDRAPIEVTYEDLGGLRHVVQKVREMIELPLKHPELFERLRIDPPKGSSPAVPEEGCVRGLDFRLLFA